MKKLLKDNYVYIFNLIILVLCSLYLFVKYSKVERIVYLNQDLHPQFDDFFRKITHIGDEKFWILSIIGLSVFSFRKAFVLGISGTITAIIVFAFKYGISNNFRPIKYIQENNLDINQLNLVEGFQNKLLLSFPSGHSSMVFCTFVIFIILSERRYFKQILFIIAFTSAFSRIYLYEHFLEDVLAGALIGSGVSFIVYYYSTKVEFIKKGIFNKNLISFIKK